MRLLPVAWIVVASQFLLGATIYVPDDYLHISAAVKASSPGDEIVVRCGVYEDDPETWIRIEHPLEIRSETRDASCVRLRNSSFAVWDSFRLEGIYSEGDEFVRPGLYGYDVEFYAKNCVFTRWTGAMILRESVVTLESCQVMSNDGDTNADAGAIEAKLVYLSDSYIGDNKTWYGSAGAIIADELHAERTTFFFNRSYRAESSVVPFGTFVDCTFDRDGYWEIHPAVPSILEFTRCVFAAPYNSMMRFNAHSTFDQCTLNPYTLFYGGAVSVRRSLIARAGSFYTDQLTTDRNILSVADGSDADKVFAAGDNLVADPQFCGADFGDFAVYASSPALPQNNHWGEQIGAFGQGCGVVSVESMSWSRMKALYR